MPTGHCKSPEHYNPSAWPMAAFLGALLFGALVLFEWHSALLALIVVVLLGVALGFVTMLVHREHPARRAREHAQLVIPTAARPQLPASPRFQVAVSQVVNVHAAPDRGSTRALRAEVAALRAQLETATAAVRPAQHLHLHGLSPEQIAAAARLSALAPDSTPAAIETGR